MRIISCPDSRKGSWRSSSRKKESLAMVVFIVLNREKVLIFSGKGGLYVALTKNRMWLFFNGLKIRFC